MLPRLEVFVSVALLFVATLSSAASQGREHTVIILASSYFPDEIVVQSGDSVRFVNSSGADHVVLGTDENWSTGPIPNNGEVVVPFQDGLVGEYFSSGDVSARGAIWLAKR